MSESQSHPAEPDEPELDPEIEELLKFEPAPRQNKRRDGWTAALQRRFIAELARTGSPTMAAEAVGKNRYGVEKLYKSPGAEGFRAAWDSAVALFEGRSAERVVAENADRVAARPPFVDRRRARWPAQAGPQPGQVLNEFGEWEDEASLHRRAEEARDSISNKLLRARRLYLQEISGNAGKRAAFEILTELPVDWDKAERLEPQPDEPWRRTNQRQPDMILTAESGWSFGECGYGPDRKAEARKAIDKYRQAEGLPAIDWEDGERRD